MSCIWEDLAYLLRQVRWDAEAQKRFKQVLKESAPAALGPPIVSSIWEVVFENNITVSFDAPDLMTAIERSENYGMGPIKKVVKL